MTAVRKKKESITFLPELRADDLCANYWMRQVTLRLRREISWCWHERGLQHAEGAATLPPFSDKVSATLDMSRFWAEKQNFYMTDPAARYLTEELATELPRDVNKHAAQGSFGWVVEKLELDDVSAFVLALGLTVAFDGSMGSVIAACLNDQAKTYPTLSLAQRLWDEPQDVLHLADPFHPLFRCGLVRYGTHSSHYQAETGWDAPITVPSLVASQLLFNLSPLPHGVVALDTLDKDEALTETARIASLRLRAMQEEALRIVPVLGPKGAARREVVQAIAHENGKQVVEFKGDAALVSDSQYLNSVATVCWLRNVYLFFGKEVTASPGVDKHRALENFALPAQTIPATIFLALTERSQLSQLPANLLLPAVHVPATTYQERIEHWKKELGAKAKGLDRTIAECSRRFRFERETIRAVSTELKELPGKITAADFIAACRAELDSDIGELASRVMPRFDKEDLVLPHKQHLQFTEILKAMQSLTEVHYGWGTGQVWNEGGIAVLFAGPPGTGKTMAAEILAIKLDLPMYRIDLSQVVNKYIGETEKNLKRVFDAADISDMVLFFDEADSLFGRRTEVSDAHDRYANLEISYLLERMERFKGLAILATNRKKDLDEALSEKLLRILGNMTLADTGKAIGAVSEAIRQRLSTIANMTVTVGRPEPPDSPPAGKKLNIFLYESQFDASFKNYPLEDGQPPPVWLVLKYLLTAFAADGATSDSVEAHENLGLGIRALQELSILRLTPGLPSSVVKALSDNPENLHITFDEAPTELLSKVMMQGDEKYRLSIAFQVRPVMIAPSELPSYSLLVGVDYTTSPASVIGEDGIQTVVLPSMGPTITEISPLGFEIGDTVTIYGDDLHLSNLSVNLGPVELPVTMQQPDRLEFVVRDDVVTGNVISAGSHAISVGQLLPSGRKRLSNLLVGNLLPTLSSATILAGSLQTVGVPPPPPPPPAGWKFATINLAGKLLGQNDKDDFYFALYRNGATVKVFENDPPLEHLKDTSSAGARQTARQCVMVRADAVPPGKYLVLYRVNGQQAVQSAELDMT